MPFLIFHTACARTGDGCEDIGYPTLTPSHLSQAQATCWVSRAGAVARTSHTEFLHTIALQHLPLTRHNLPQAERQVPVVPTAQHPSWRQRRQRPPRLRHEWPSTLVVSLRPAARG